MSVTKEVIERLIDADSDEEAVRLLNQHVLTEAERVELAQAGYTIGDVMTGRIQGGLERYKSLAQAVNDRLGFKFFNLDYF
jgi:hypothetical protein